MVCLYFQTSNPWNYIYGITWWRIMLYIMVKVDKTVWLQQSMFVLMKLALSANSNEMVWTLAWLMVNFFIYFNNTACHSKSKEDIIEFLLTFRVLLGDNENDYYSNYFSNSKLFWSQQWSDRIMIWFCSRWLSRWLYLHFCQGLLSVSSANPSWDCNHKRKVSMISLNILLQPISTSLAQLS